MNSHPVAFFEGVDDRDGAESLVKAILWIDADAAAQPAEDDAWYDHQLVGLDVVRDGSVVGSIVRVDHLPAQDLLIIKRGDDEVMIPFVAAIVPEVDIAGGHVIVTPPPGLFEDLVEDDDAESDGAETSAPDAPTD
jgi:16S rRNA processing protein RimM